MDKYQKELDEMFKKLGWPYWTPHEITVRLFEEGGEFAILTNIIHEEWSGLSVRGHKKVKGLKTHNLRDHMTEAELIFTALA